MGNEIINSEALKEELETARENIGVIEAYMSTLPTKLISLGIRVVLTVLLFVVGNYLNKILRKIIRRSLERTGSDRGIIQFIDSFVRISGYVLLVFIAAGYFGVDSATIVAVLGSAGVAVGLAVQGSLSNFAGGVLILALHPFRVGDYITSGGIEGTVTEIEMFYTKITTVDNKMVIIPNSRLSNDVIINANAHDERRIILDVGISYEADIDRAREVLMGVLDQETAALADMERLVVVSDLGDSAVQLQIRFYVKGEDFLTAKWRVTENAKKALDRAGIVIAYPQMDVHLVQ